MKVKIIRLVGIALVLLSSPLVSLAQQTQSSPKQTPPKEEAPVPPSSPFKVVIFDVKHQDPAVLAQALVGSRAAGTSIIPNQPFKTITVRDYEENIKVIGEAIKRFDVPSPPMPPPASIDFQLHIIAASLSAPDKTPMPASLEKVVVQLKSTLKYTDYKFLTTLANRVINGGNVNANGIISPPFALPAGAAPNIRSTYDYQLRNVRLHAETAVAEFFQIGQFKFSLSVPLVHQSGGIAFSNVGIDTVLSLREGESAVVGTANVGSSDEAIIVVVTARRVK